MQRPWSLVALVLLGSQALAEEPRPGSPFPLSPAAVPDEGAGRREVFFPENGSTQADDDSNEPKDHSPRIPLDKDTTFQFGTGGIGLGRKF